MREVVALAARVAAVDSTMLITGESGVGKERLAQFVHEQSRRASKPFVPVNCAALTDSLLESELFGHRRGAFTGAVEDRQGLFEAAAGGTLFLDEIGDISPAMQVRLLRVLQERSVRRLGENHYRPFDVRVIAATNRDLFREVNEGRFRSDLYYRLNVVAIHIPPLRERPEDLRLLLRRLLQRAIDSSRCPAKGYTPAALKAMLSYSWPGNIRELENAIERACALVTGPLVDELDLPPEVRRHGRQRARHDEPRSLAEMEREWILRAVQSEGGNRLRAARRLGISRQTLLRRLHTYGS
jgi:transcriptional regulator with PAS, ATPase and Fis domain